MWNIAILHTCARAHTHTRAHTSTSTEVWFENSEFARESWRRNFMKFQSRGGPCGRSREAIREISYGRRERSPSRRWETIDSVAYYRENTGCQVLMQLAALRPRVCVCTCEISHVNCAHRAYTGGTWTRSFTAARDENLIRLNTVIIKTKGKKMWEKKNCPGPRGKPSA